jgi:tRNA dimethylallyltransferase
VSPESTPVTLYVLAGPTAVGKTAVSLPLARALNAEILIADSRQVFRGMDIGTAKPSAAERSTVPHHGLDLRAPDEVFSAAEFVAMAGRAITDITARGKRVLLVGGTGMYLKALEEGWDFGGVGADPVLRAELARFDLPTLTAQLLAHDPDAGELVDLANPVRVRRALEIVRMTGRPLREVRGRGASPYRLAGVVLTRDRATLAERIDQRLRDMVHAGWIEEVRRLQEERPWPAESPARTGIGYQELASYLVGEATLAAALERAAARTRQYAKRQQTWFRAQAFDWVELGSEESPESVAIRILAIAGS